MKPDAKDYVLFNSTHMTFEKGTSMDMGSRSGAA